MTWELYEVWSDTDGHEELVETTKSKKEALVLAKKTLGEGADEVWICRETGDGDYDEIERLTNTQLSCIINILIDNQGVEAHGYY